MANELKHGSVGTELTQAEWEGIGTHVIESQATGDIIYASSSSQLRRLAKGTDTHVLILSSGVPAWSTSTGITALGTIATGVWQGTDVGVAYGGTGVSTLASNSVLTGTGASAITAESNLTFTGSLLTVIGAVTVGVDDAGHDVTFFGNTASSYMLWDTSADSLVLAPTNKLFLDGGVDTYIKENSANIITIVTGNTVVATFGNNSADFVGNATIDGDLTFTGPQTISTSTGNLTIGAATGADVLIGDNATLLTVDGGAPGVKIGTGALTANTHFDIDPATFTAAVDGSARVIRVLGTITEAGSGTHASIGGMEINPPTITGGSAAVTDTFTVKIVNAPTATVTGANYALWVDDGTSRFDGPVEGVTNYQEFTSSGTWTKPATGTIVTVEVIGGGAGGGGGEGRAVSNYRVGGGGGGGAARVRYEFDIADLGSTETVTIGAAGTAGAGGTNADGAWGNDGGNTTFGSRVTGYGGAGGGYGGGGNGLGGDGSGWDDAEGPQSSLNGIGFGGADGGASGGAGGFAEWGGGGGGSCNTAGATGRAGGGSVQGAGAGGSGASTDNANPGTERAGGAGGASGKYAAGGGGAGGGVSAAGSAGAAVLGIAGGGGGGGGSTNDGTGGAGAAGAAPGGGGGGGAGGTNTGGAGAVGGVGECRVWTR